MYHLKPFRRGWFVCSGSVFFYIQLFMRGSLNLTFACVFVCWTQSGISSGSGVSLSAFSFSLRLYSCISARRFPNANWMSLSNTQNSNKLDIDWNKVRRLVFSNKEIYNLNAVTAVLRFAILFQNDSATICPVVPTPQCHDFPHCPNTGVTLFATVSWKRLFK